MAILSGRGGAQTLRERTEDVAMMARSQGREVMVIAADGRSGLFMSESPHLAGHVMLRSQMNADTVLPVQGTVIVDRAERLSLKRRCCCRKALSAGAQLIFMDTENRQGTGNALSVLKEPVSRSTGFMAHNCRKYDWSARRTSEAATANLRRTMCACRRKGGMWWPR
ncbi:ssDNA-binding domain-containing protein [Escherichia coli]